MRKFSVAILFVFTLMVTFSSISGAAEFITGRDCTVPKDTVIEGDLYAFGRSLTVDGTVTGDLIVFIDADGSHNPSEIPLLVAPILEDRADHVTGSRLIGGSDELHGGFDEFLRLTGSSLITACINWKLNVRLSDSQNGFRAIKTEVIKKLDLKEKITTIEQEMIIKTLKKGFRMAEVPTHENRRVAGYSKISVRKVWFRYVYSFLKYLFYA